MFGWLFGGTDEEKEKLEEEFSDFLEETHRTAANAAYKGRDGDKDAWRAAADESLQTNRKAKSWFRSLFGGGGDDSEEHY